MKIGEAMYQNAGDAEPGAESQESDADDVVDADFEEVKDDDKKSA